MSLIPVLEFWLPLTVLASISMVFPLVKESTVGKQWQKIQVCASSSILKHPWVVIILSKIEASVIALFYIGCPVELLHYLQYTKYLKILLLYSVWEIFQVESQLLLYIVPAMLLQETCNLWFVIYKKEENYNYSKELNILKRESQRQNLAKAKFILVSAWPMYRMKQAHCKTPLPVPAPVFWILCAL